AAGRIYAYDAVAKRYVSTTPEKTKFYTLSTTDGSYSITSALYVPKAGQTGTVTLTCVAYRRSGESYEDNIIITAINKTASASFADVGSDMSWAANAVDFSRKLGLVGGTDNAGRALFSPRNTMRRGDLVLILYRLAGSPSVSAMMPYTDVPTPTTSYSTEIYNSAMWAYSNGIMRNIADGTLYDPNTALTRQDFAQILFNYTKAMGGNVANNGNINSYSDANQVSANTREGVIWAVANGYITSTTSGLTIEPTRAATRAEIVTLLHRYLTY
ncbi:MAG: S-layer homology domain-containing protein, partial [Oscillospiraceae bacterium]|nr:S-layer homology domain-containing protein [Oscillospiraceae bacterium]